MFSASLDDSFTGLSYTSAHCDNQLNVSNRRERAEEIVKIASVLLQMETDKVKNTTGYIYGMDLTISRKGHGTRSDHGYVGGVLITDKHYSLLLRGRKQAPYSIRW